MAVKLERGFPCQPPGRKFPVRKSITSIRNEQSYVSSLFIVSISLENNSSTYRIGKSSHAQVTISIPPRRISANKSHCSVIWFGHPNEMSSTVPGWLLIDAYKINMLSPKECLHVVPRPNQTQPPNSPALSLLHHFGLLFSSAKSGIPLGECQIQDLNLSSVTHSSSHLLWRMYVKDSLASS